MAELKDKLVRLGSVKVVKDYIEEEVKEVQEAIRDVGTDFDEHVDNTEIHVTSAEKEKWNKHGITISCEDQMLEFKYD